MTDGAAYLMTMFYGAFAGNRWKDQRNANSLDGGAPYYNTYQCSDGRWISVGSIEPQFYALLLEKSGAADLLPQPQLERTNWPEMKQTFASIFRTKTCNEWCAIMENTGVCFAPVLSMAEAPHHPHNVARKIFAQLDGVTTPAPALRFSATPSAIQCGPRPAGDGVHEALDEWCVSIQRIEELVSEGGLPRG